MIANPIINIIECTVYIYIYIYICACVYFYMKASLGKCSFTTDTIPYDTGLDDPVINHVFPYLWFFNPISHYI